MFIRPFSGKKSSGPLQIQSMHAFGGGNLDDHDNMASEVDCIINCVVIFYEEGKGGENFRKKNKFRCKVNPNEKRVVKLCETIR